MAVLGAHTPHKNLLLRAHAALVLSLVLACYLAYLWSPPSPSTQAGYHGTCLGMHSATWKNTWQRHNFAPIAPSRDQLGTHRMQTFLISSTLLFPPIRLVGIRIWG